MAHASLSARALALALAAGLLPAANAVADDRASISDPSAADAPRDWIDAVPARCAAFATISGASSSSGGRPDATHAWRQLFSLAACVQDASVPSVDEPEELEEMVDDLSRLSALPMLVYLDALEHAEASIQLRAAFHIGMAYVAMSTRARSALAAPPDLATNAAAERRYRELHARLEPLLLPARRAAWVAFLAIDQAAAQDEELARGEVERNMVCTARQMLAALRDAAPSEATMLALAPACEGAPAPITTAAR